jgi:hypothetical protein
LFFYLTHISFCCRNIDFEARTACAKHLEVNVASCPSDIKELAKDLLYGRCLSTHMAREIRDTLLTLVHRSQTISFKTKEWFVRTFGTEEGMKVSARLPI